MSKGNPVIETERSIYFSQHYVWDNEFIYFILPLWVISVSFKNEIYLWTTRRFDDVSLNNKIEIW